MQCFSSDLMWENVEKADSIHSCKLCVFCSCCLDSVVRISRQGKGSDLNDLFEVGDVTETKEREFRSVVSNSAYSSIRATNTTHLHVSLSLSPGSEIFHAEHDTGKNIAIARRRCDGFTVSWSSNQDQIARWSHSALHLENQPRDDSWVVTEMIGEEYDKRQPD